MESDTESVKNLSLINHDDSFSSLQESKSSENVIINLDKTMDNTIEKTIEHDPIVPSASDDLIPALVEFNAESESSSMPELIDVDVVSGIKSECSRVLNSTCINENNDINNKLKENIKHKRNLNKNVNNRKRKSKSISHDGLRIQNSFNPLSSNLYTFNPIKNKLNPSYPNTPESNTSFNNISRDNRISPNTTDSINSINSLGFKHNLTLTPDLDNSLNNISKNLINIENSDNEIFYDSTNLENDLQLSGLKNNNNVHALNTNSNNSGISDEIMKITECVLGNPITEMPNLNKDDKIKIEQNEVYDDEISKLNETMDHVTEDLRSNLNNLSHVNSRVNSNLKLNPSINNNISLNNNLNNINLNKSNILTNLDNENAHASKFYSDSDSNVFINSAHELNNDLNNNSLNNNDKSNNVFKEFTKRMRDNKVLTDKNSILSFDNDGRHSLLSEFDNVSINKSNNVEVFDNNGDLPSAHEQIILTDNTHASKFNDTDFNLINKTYKRKLNYNDINNNLNNDKRLINNLVNYSNDRTSDSLIDNFPAKSTDIPNDKSSKVVGTPIKPELSNGFNHDNPSDIFATPNPIKENNRGINKSNYSDNESDDFVSPNNNEEIKLNSIVKSSEVIGDNNYINTNPITCDNLTDNLADNSRTKVKQSEEILDNPISSDNNRHHNLQSEVINTPIINECNKTEINNINKQLKNKYNKDYNINSEINNLTDLNIDYCNLPQTFYTNDIESNNCDSDVIVISDNEDKFNPISKINSSETVGGLATNVTDGSRDFNPSSEMLGDPSTSDDKAGFPCGGQIDQKGAEIKNSILNNNINNNINIDNIDNINNIKINYNNLVKDTNENIYDTQDLVGNGQVIKHTLIKGNEIDTSRPVLLQVVNIDIEAYILEREIPIEERLKKTPLFNFNKFIVVGELDIPAAVELCIQTMYINEIAVVESTARLAYGSFDFEINNIFVPKNSDIFFKIKLNSIFEFDNFCVDHPAELLKLSHWKKSIGNYYFKHDDFSLASSCYINCLKCLAFLKQEKVLEISIKNNLALSYMKLKEYKSAIKNLGEILKVDPSHYKALLRMAICQEATGSFKEALENYNKVAAIQPDENVANYISNLKEKVKKQQEELNEFSRKMFNNNKKMEMIKDEVKVEEKVEEKGGFDWKKYLLLGFPVVLASGFFIAKYLKRRIRLEEILIIGLSCRFSIRIFYS